MAGRANHKSLTGAIRAMNEVRAGADPGVAGQQLTAFSEKVHEEVASSPHDFYSLWRIDLCLN